MSERVHRPWSWTPLSLSSAAASWASPRRSRPRPGPAGTGLRQGPPAGGECPSVPRCPDLPRLPPPHLPVPPRPTTARAHVAVPARAPRRRWPPARRRSSRTPPPSNCLRNRAGRSVPRHSALPGPGVGVGGQQPWQRWGGRGAALLHQPEPRHPPLEPPPPFLPGTGSSRHLRLDRAPVPHPTGTMIPTGRWGRAWLGLRPDPAGTPSTP